MDLDHLVASVIDYLGCMSVTLLPVGIADGFDAREPLDATFNFKQLTLTRLPPLRS